MRGTKEINELTIYKWITPLKNVKLTIKKIEIEHITSWRECDWSNKKQDKKTKKA